MADNPQHTTLADEIFGGGGGSGGSGAGQDIFDTQGNFLGRLAFTNTPGQTPQPYLTDPARPGFVTVPPGQLGGTFLNSIGKAISIGPGGITILGSLPTGATGGAGPAFSSTRAGIEFAAGLSAEEAERNRQFERREGRRGREFQAGENVLSREFESKEAATAREASERLNLVNLLGQLAQTAAGLQQSREQSLADTLGDDPFRFAAQASGATPLGVSPAQAFREQLTQQVTQGAPGVNLGANNAGLQGQATQLQDFINTPSAQQPILGFSHGGVIQMTPDDEGAFAMAEGDTQAVLVGEGKRGEGLAAGTAEVLEINKRTGRVRVIPLLGGAAHGASGIFGAEPQQALNIEQSLAPLFRNFGFDRAPKVALSRRSFGEGFGLGPGQLQLAPGGGFDFAGAQRGGSAATLKQLGYSPNLIRNPQTGAISFIEDGQLRSFRDMDQFNALGFNPSDVLNLQGNPLAELAALGVTGVGDPLGDQPRPLLGQESGSFPRRTIPLIDPSTGIMLPALREVANVFPQLDPSMQEFFLNAYKNAVFPGGQTLGAGIPRDAAINELLAFSPRGTAQQGQTATIG